MSQTHRVVAAVAFAAVAALATEPARALLSANSATTAHALACAEIEGLEPVLRSKTGLVLGEIHGSRQSPAFVGEVACRALAADLSVTVGLELLDRDEAGVETYLASGGTEADRAALTAGGSWSAEYQDGRNSRAMLDLLERLRIFRAAGHPITVELFDRRIRGSGKERDRLMAEALSSVLETTDSDILLVLTGNIHSRVTRGTRWNANHEPMAHLLTVPEDWILVALDVAHAGGTSWICTSGEAASCGARRLRGGDTETSRLSIELGSDPATTGHHGSYHVGRLSASLPAAGEPRAAAEGAIARASRAFSEAYQQNDTGALAGLYTEDAVVLPPGREIRGREAAANYFRWGPRYRQLAHAMTSEELVIRDDVAVDIGTWRSTGQVGEDPPSSASGRYLIVWFRESDGIWRMRYDMWHRPAPETNGSPD